MCVTAALRVHAGRIDQRRELAEAGEHAFHRLRARLLGGDVGEDSDRVTAVCDDRIRSLRSGLADRIHTGNARSLGGEPQRRGTADPWTSAGD